MAAISSASTDKTQNLIVWLLTLENDGSPPKDKKFLRVKQCVNQANAIRFRIPAGYAASMSPVLLTNYPLDGSEYDRSTFHRRQFIKDNGSDMICDFLVEKPGPYQYSIEYTVLKASSKGDGADNGTKVTKTSPVSYFLVDPQIYLNQNWLSLDGIVVQSASSKWLGPLNRWSKIFSQSSELGYNMIHFMPIQKRGESNSPYSIYDQLDLDDSIFSGMDVDITSTSSDDKAKRWALLENEIKSMESDLGLLSATDVVWNHTANNSEWLQHHPEAGYNVKNSPHLRSAVELDGAIANFSSELDKYGVQRMVHSEKDIDRVIDAFNNNVLKGLNLWQYYVIDVEETVKDVASLIDQQVASDTDHEISEYNVQENDASLNFLSGKFRINKTLGHRFGRNPDPQVALNVIYSICGSGASKDEVLNRLRKILDFVNLPLYREYDQDLTAIKDNIRNRVVYERLSKDSPKFQKPINDRYRLVEPLFTRLPRNEVTKHLSEDEMALANNGWIWAGNPLDNFAGPESKVYLRREVIVWGDCVKLNYGDKPEDNPWIWEHMKEYTMTMARLFHGFRIDNCHSTPIKLAEYLIDHARTVRPNLYLAAELFTQSEETDNLFVYSLGINSLIREAMQAWDVKELSRLIHRHGGQPFGSMDLECLGVPGTFKDKNGKEIDCTVAPIRGSLPHAIFFDCTHDNETPFKVRQACDALPNAALVAMTASAIGSNKGYDELYPHLLDLVNETGLYSILDDPLSVGIGKPKQILNELHQKMTEYQEVHVHHEGEFITVHRQHPVNRDGYLLVAHCAYPGANENAHFSNPRLYYTKAEPIFAYRLKVDTSSHQDKAGSPDKCLRGLSSELVDLGTPSLVNGSDHQGEFVELGLPHNFGPGSVLLIRTHIEHISTELEEMIRQGCDDIMNKLDLGALNAVLYRCSSEEHDTVGTGIYEIPSFASLPYAGLQGWMSYLSKIVSSNDLGHPICDNLRQGHWALDYTVNRLDSYKGLYPELEKLAEWFSKIFLLAKQAPNFLMPKYFSMAITVAYKSATKRALSLLNSDITRLSDFSRSLALTSIQMVGATKSSTLRPQDKDGQLTLAAGLPHFTTNHMRCWGRDTFIALDGLLLATGRLDEARDHILGFGSTMKHGLIPNLLDSGRFPRYNARDATWFWLKAVQDYCRESEEGLDFLNVKVTCRFPDDNTFVPWDDEKAYSRERSIAQTIQDIMEHHAQGISFREWNAGPSLDQAMRNEGFNIDIHVDWKNGGLIKGGNLFNCGTWMDKMGDSEKANIRGIPGSPRDGADIEIIGLLKYTLNWLAELSESQKFPYSGVTNVTVDDKNTSISYAEWRDLLNNSFERQFYVPEDQSLDSEYHVDSNLVNRRGIYRDTVGGLNAWADYQFRPNICVAMAVAPELFDADHARTCLEKMGELLRGPLGMRTLDPGDQRYRPNYDNSNDSDDPLVAHGINYHSGPEWVWCYGYYLQALLNFYSRNDTETQTTIQAIYSLLLPHSRCIDTTPYAGLPELTNLDGAYCHDSCPTQAWSSATILALLYKISKIQHKS
ncbi:bifunctional 4-alpha-glucanotransferase/amylo-alpha-1,6-glucosidase [Mycoemilia scoparia]|uniref:Glycogen debranching enzyme n=1 Tax=Mycoemilia scoparia TaxID=417184 RepID=A0A9W8A457_9FUNG|nr:bifunctional 4-alpha-glucanotransferase/amylo-alpha-1,6-glucosidase [Mycoemilia scoparia]